MQDSLSFALTQISYLVFNINKRNFSQNVRLINKVSFFLCMTLFFVTILDSHFCRHRNTKKKKIQCQWKFFVF